MHRKPGSRPFRRADTDESPKTLSRRGRGALFTVLFLALSGPLLAQKAMGPQDMAAGPMHRQLWLVPSQDARTPMRALVFRPDGPGPFPLAVINHGSWESAELRAAFVQPEYEAAVQWFVARGYAVALPLRPGHGATGGPYLESSGPCERADFVKAGMATADSIEAALAFLSTQPFVKRGGTVIVGHSAGGWGALALASRNPRDVRAVIAFAAGRGGRVNGRPDNNCAPDRLVEAARAFGDSARLPVLAIYAENDSYVGPNLSRKIAVAFRIGGGHFDYRLLPSFGRDGHALFAQGVDLWGPMVDDFLKAAR